MIQPNQVTVAEAGQIVAAATAKQQAGELRAAVDKFAAASSLLKSELQRLEMESRTKQLPVDAAQRQFLESYVAQLEQQRASLDEAAEDQEAAQMQKEREAVRQRKKQHEEERAKKEALLKKELSVPKHDPTSDKKNTTTSGTSTSSSSSPSSSSVPAPTPPAATPPQNITTGNNPSGGPALPPPSKINSSDLDSLVSSSAAAAPSSSGKYAGTKLIAGGALRTSNFTARASDIVYRAIEHATRLAGAGQYKAAADVVQHAYAVGSREDHRPNNLEKLPLLAKDLRIKFQGRHAPRRPQDNARTAEERDVLRASGRTARLLLFEWDSVEDGYPYENVWMPGHKGNAAFEDEFVPKMAPDQLKAKPRFIRFPEMVDILDEFRGVGKQQKEREAAAAAAASAKDDEKNNMKDEFDFVDLEEVNNDAPGPRPKQSQEEDGDGDKKKKNEEEDGGAGAGAGGVGENATGPEPTPLCLIYSTPDPMAIRQTVVSDCSLVCSLIVTANYERRFPNARLIRSALFPQNESGDPVVNPRGKYCVKMLLNGTTRVVAVDDRFPVQHVPESNGSVTLPCDRPPVALCSHTTNPGEMWVSLMEKAFIKVCGGSYDFPGSNSSNDLYRLSGWLPDILRFPNTGQRYGVATDTMASGGDAAAAGGDKPFDADLQWRRLSGCHARGAVLLTIATPSELPKVVEEELKLIPGHAYAVLDFRQTSPAQGNYRLVKVKNPWSSQPWRGLFGIEDSRRCTPEMLAELSYSKEEAEQGVFWMTWQDVVKFFAVAHLSWNPFSLFPSPQQRLVRPTRLSRHGHDRSTTSGYCESHQFQILIPPSQVCNSNRRMHLVLSRHVLDDSEYEENEAVSSTSATGGGSTNKATAPFIAVHVYDTTMLPSLSAQCKAATGNVPLWQARFSAGGGRRLKSRAETDFCKCLHRGVYSNSVASTFSFDCPAGPRELCVIVSRLPRDKKNKQQQQQQVVQLSHDDCTPFPFTVTLYTNLPYTGPACCLQTEQQAMKSSSSSSKPAVSPSSPQQQQQQGAASSVVVPVSSSAVHFTAMPPLKAQLRYRTVVPVEWKSGQSCGGPVGQQTFTYNPQFTFTLSQDCHLQAEIISPVECPVNIIICRLKDGAESNISNEEQDSCQWALRVDNVSSANYPLALWGPYSCKYGSALDSSLADCIAIGDKARAPPVVVATAPSPQATTPTTTTTPSSFLEQQLSSLVLEVRIPNPGGTGPQQAFLGAFSDYPSLLHAVRAAPLAAWLVPLLLSKGYLAGETLSKAVCFGGQLDWAAPLAPAVLQRAVEQKEFVVVVILATEELPRTADLSGIEKNLAPAATTALQVIAAKGTDFATGAAALNDAVERQVLALDSCPSVRTEDVKKTRSVLVRAFQSIHALVDFIAKNPPPPPPQQQQQQQQQVNTTPVDAPKQQQGGEEEQKRNPLRTIQTVPAGRYVVVAAMQEKGVPGPFSVAVECEEEDVELRMLPAEGAGWSALPNVTAAWMGSSAAGPPAPHGSDDGWSVYRKNPTVQLTVPPAANKNTQQQQQQNQMLLFCRLLSLPPVGSNIAATETDVSGAPLMQLMMFKGSVSADTVVATSGKFSSNGVALRRSLSATNNSAVAESAVHGVPLQAGTTYYVVMSTFDGAKDSGWRCALKMFTHGGGGGGANNSGIQTKLLS